MHASEVEEPLTVKKQTKQGSSGNRDDRGYNVRLEILNWGNSDKKNASDNTKCSYVLTWAENKANRTQYSWPYIRTHAPPTNETPIQKEEKDKNKQRKEI